MRNREILVRLRNCREYTGWISKLFPQDQQHKIKRHFSFHLFSVGVDDKIEGKVKVSRHYKTRKYISLIQTDSSFFFNAFISVHFNVSQIELLSLTMVVQAPSQAGALLHSVKHRIKGF